MPQRTQHPAKLWVISNTAPKFLSRFKSITNNNILEEDLADIDGDNWYRCGTLSSESLMKNKEAQEEQPTFGAGVKAKVKIDLGKNET